MKEGITKITPNINYSTNFGFQNLSSGDNITNYSENIYPIQKIFQRYNYGNEEKKNFLNQIFITIQNMQQEIEALKFKNITDELKIKSITEKMYIEKMEMIQKMQKEKLEMIQKMQKEKMEIIKKMEKDKKDMQSQINKLQNFDKNTIERIRKMEACIEDLNINLPRDESLINNIKIVDQKLQYLIGELNCLKAEMNDKNKINEMNSKKILALNNQIEILKSRINELQSILVGRKLIKIIIKVILNHCFEDYEANGTIINILKYKDSKYAPYENIVNNLIKVILEKNNIIHINDKINKIIDIINIKSTYGDILNVIKPSIKKEDLENIQKLLIEKSLFNEICKDEIIGYDEDLRVIISNNCK